MRFTISNFISELNDRGVRIAGEEGNLRLTGNTKALTTDDVQWLKANKSAVLAMLRMARNPVRRYVSLDGEAEAYSSHVLDSDYWRET